MAEKYIHGHKETCTKLVHMATHTYPSIALDCNCGFDQCQNQKPKRRKINEPTTR